MAKTYKIRPDVKVEFGDNMQQKDVCEYLGISATHLSEVLHGRRNASRLLAIGISILNKQGNPDYFFEEVKE